MTRSSPGDLEREKPLTIYAESSPWQRPIVILARYTGMRTGEVPRLPWDRVDLERQRLTLEETKNGERRGIPTFDLSLETLRE